MEERLSAPLPLLPLDHDQKSLSARSIKSVASTTGPFTTPGIPNDTQLIIHWQAAALLSQIDTNVLIHHVPKLAGAYCEIEQVPIIKSYMNMLLLLQEKDTNKQWITRIPYHQEDKDFLIDVVEPLIRVNRKYCFRVPYLYHYGLAKDRTNQLGVDFMLLDFIDGRQMPMWTNSFPMWRQKAQILDQLADIYLEMFSKPVTYSDRLVLNNANNVEGMQEDFNSFDIPPAATASSYFYQLADEAIKGKFARLLAEDAMETTAMLNTTMDDRFADLLTIFLMRALIPSQVIGKYNDSPFYITHPDLHNRNIIIDGKPVPEDSIEHAKPGSYSSSNELKPSDSSCLCRKVDTNQDIKSDSLKIVGIVDWDAAHPLPLQAAAIYPKFLETLPGAEFPDLPKEYRPPNLDREKELFLHILNRKELQQTGHSIFTDLIKHGSRERDFFTVALRRGDVRLKWLEWWKGGQCMTSCSHGRLHRQFLLDEIVYIRTGMHAFLAKSEHRALVGKLGGWDLVARVVLELDRMDAFNLELRYISCGTCHKSEDEC